MLLGNPAYGTLGGDKVIDSNDIIEQRDVFFVEKLTCLHEMIRQDKSNKRGRSDELLDQTSVIQYNEFHGPTAYRYRLCKCIALVKKALGALVGTGDGDGVPPFLIQRTSPSFVIGSTSVFVPGDSAAFSECLLADTIAWIERQGLTVTEQSATTFAVACCKK